MRIEIQKTTASLFKKVILSNSTKGQKGTHHSGMPDKYRDSDLLYTVQVSKVCKIDFAAKIHRPPMC